MVAKHVRKIVVILTIIDGILSILVSASSALYLNHLEATCSLTGVSMPVLVSNLLDMLRIAIIVIILLLLTYLLYTSLRSNDRKLLIESISLLTVLVILQFVPLVMLYGVYHININVVVHKCGRLLNVSSIFS